MIAQQFNCYIYWYMPKPKIALPAIVMQQPNHTLETCLLQKKARNMQDYQKTSTLVNSMHRTLAKLVQVKEFDLLPETYK